MRYGPIHNYKVLFVMDRKIVSLLLALMCFFTSFFVHAFDEDGLDAFMLPEPLQAYWVFSGLVNTESAESVGYFFQVKRKSEFFEVQAALVDGQTNQLLFYYHDMQIIQNPTQYKWKIGNAFLRYNPINASWVFGVKTRNKKGFDFKVDMLNQPIQRNEIQNLRPGLALLVHQTSRLNGHISPETSDKEQFVTANNAWFSKLWLTTLQKNAHAVNGGYCRFFDGSGFYTQTLKEADANRAAWASWRDATGQIVKMSQFVTIAAQDDSAWKVNVMLPKMELLLTNALADKASAKGLVAGIFKASPSGFCFFSEQIFTLSPSVEEKEEKPVLPNKPLMQKY